MLTITKIKYAICISCFLAAFFTANSISASEKYDTSEDSLASYDVPQWYSEGKLGFFMHLGVFSVPAYKNEWYPTNMYYTADNPNMQRHPEYASSFVEHHTTTYGDRKSFGYKDFIPQLTLDKFDADYYAELIANTGATYFAAPAIHHDGFAMWDSKEIEWNAMKMGPKRDVVKELTDAMRKKGIKAGVSTHYGRHWKYYNFRPQFDTWDPANEGLYGKRRGDTEPPRPEDALKWERVMNELIDSYQPDYIFVDGGVCDARTEYNKDYFSDALRRVTAKFYNTSVELDKTVALSWKRDALNPGEAIYDTEKTIEGGIQKRPWQAHFTVNGSWGYAGDKPAFATDSILRGFIDIVSRNGNLLLNIGPKPDGTLDKNQERALIEIGQWMQVNGDAIHKSTPWKIYGEGTLNGLRAGGAKNWHYDKSAIRYTEKDGDLYAWFVDWPANGKVTLPQTAQFNAKKIELINAPSALTFTTKDNAIIVNLPQNKSGQFVWGLRLSK
ncbi:alpha-L-fucosidase [Thalassotalea crassostreae]|uniref:alpha-L-fucosidase n=1 Tax=Thalassotalea crassostreae TaxID=1763536 RepID=UPI000839593F|nr:alpha-L-fucosidase [Thalassotalea crassostreae]